MIIEEGIRDQLPFPEQQNGQMSPQCCQNSRQAVSQKIWCECRKIAGDVLRHDYFEANSLDLFITSCWDPWATYCCCRLQVSEAVVCATHVRSGRVRYPHQNSRLYGQLFFLLWLQTVNDSKAGEALPLMTRISDASRKKFKVFQLFWPGDSFRGPGMAMRSDYHSGVQKQKLKIRNLLKNYVRLVETSTDSCISSQTKKLFLMP